MQHDAIIVGGGSAGAVLAARLSEDPDRTVLLEAGPVYQPRHFPAILADTSIIGGGGTSYDGGYMSEPGYVGHPQRLHS